MWSSQNKNGGTDIWRSSKIELITGLALLNLFYFIRLIKKKKRACCRACHAPITKDSK